MSGGSLRERLGRLRGRPSADRHEGPDLGGIAAPEGSRPDRGMAAADPPVCDPEAVSDSPVSDSEAASHLPVRDPETEAWSRLGFELRTGSGGECLTREVEYAADHRHGHFAVADLLTAGTALARLDPAGRHVAPERLLYLDTETTGLGQGAGNVPFLIGLGWWTGEAFIVRQHLIRHPGEEAAMLAMLAEKLPSFSHLVTYNGRTFDWPLVKNRFVMHRMKPPKDPAHFDFLYPSRSLWRTTLPSVRLGAVEEAKLGIFREDDIPGAMAPQLYFRYLAERDVSLLAGVIRHNELDIATLLTLSIHFGRLLCGGAAGFDKLGAPELLRTGLWYERLGFEEEACAAMAALADRPAAEAVEQWAEAALFFKRRRRWNEAVRLWRKIAEAEQDRAFARIEPLVELAIAFEHRLRNIDAALYWTDAALAALERRLTPAARFAGNSAKLREQLGELHRRRERLLRKLGGGAGALF